MPIIEMYVPDGTVDEQTKRRLHERVGRQVLEVEGATYDESPLAQAITWMLIHEVPEGSWSVGGELLASGEEPRVLTRVSVPHGALNRERTEAVAARVNEEVVAALGEGFADPTKSFCVIEEKQFSGGGVVAGFEDIMRWLGLEREPAQAAGNGGIGI
jgi:phenylpyruvate tautomerase PptA (4-oxalocrotonate tautomerase family)